MKYYYALFSTLLLLLLFPVGSQAGYVTITADTLQKWISTGTSFDFLLIDVRETSEATKVIATDICKPYLLPWNSGVFASTMNKLPKDTAIVIYCASGNRSGQAAKKLSDSGFVKVYSLTGGFNGWGTRPTKASSDIKPTDKLPEPSMFKKSSMIKHERKFSSQRLEFHFSGNTILVASPIAARHTLSLFNAQGKCVLSKLNPFAYGTACVAAGLSEGFFLVKLESSGTRSIEAIRIAK
jgi:rhodanese-related sulfurtransferase